MDGKESLKKKQKKKTPTPPSQISDMPQAGFEPTQNLNSGFVEWSYAEVITTTTYNTAVEN